MAVTATSDQTFELVAPLAGWVLPLSQVPDPVFAGGMAGDGVAIDPIGESLHAPCDGVIALMGGNRHALTLKSRAGDVLIHVGIDTVQMAGAGFALRVRDGQEVHAGQALLDFDLDLIVRSAPSAATPILLTGQHPGRIIRRQSGRRVAVGDFLYAAEPMVPAPTSVASGVAAPPLLPAVMRRFRVPFEHGLHARPAAQVAAVLTGLDAEVLFSVRGREANARSVVSMMALGARHGEFIAATATGRQAEAALAALSGPLESIAEPAPAPRPLSIAAPPGRAPDPGARLAGLVAARGLAVGLAAPLLDVDPPTGAALGDAAAERARLVAAIDTVSQFLKKLGESRQGAQRSLLDAHLLLLADPQLLRDAETRLSGGASAGLAWRTALRSAADALAALQDPRMAERRADLLDIERQVLRALLGAPINSDAHLPDRAIVLAAELLPSQLLSLDSARLAGICTAEGGATSHLAILAASMGLPALVAAGSSVLAIAADTPLVLDAEAGFLLVNPPPAERRRLEELLITRAQARVRDEAAAQQPAVMRDGTKIDVYCNLGATEEAAPAVRAGADGCGLLRTEFLFQARQFAPNEDEQLAQYQAIADALSGRPLTIRTLDAGGDKPMPYLVTPREENPALGLRGVRSSLGHPELLTTQLRAILRVAPAGQCRVLLPMVTDLDDVRGVRAQLGAIAAEFRIPAPPLGVMIETPASALLADQLAAECEFISIGSNDLSQYTLAMDRLHPSLAARLDALHPAVLRLIERATQASHDHRIEAGVCGAVASDPEAVPVLIGLGVRELSVVPAQIPRVKSLLRTLDPANCAALARQALSLPHAAAVRALVRDWSGNDA
jgi:multiphosphoryl transfer protein